MDMSVILWAHREFDLHGHALDVLDAALNAVKMSTPPSTGRRRMILQSCAPTPRMCIGLNLTLWPTLYL